MVKCESNYESASSAGTFAHDLEVWRKIIAFLREQFEQPGVDKEPFAADDPFFQDADPGSYQYAWTSLGAASATAVANLAKDPATSQMYVQYGFNQ